uniref:PUB domain-containing protein n=1 Tax=Caenorhabditis tropicalis TaxID=1561998 RepID=A0A1I7TUE3_9PELO
MADEKLVSPYQIELITVPIACSDPSNRREVVEQFCKVFRENARKEENASEVEIIERVCEELTEWLEEEEDLKPFDLSAEQERAGQKVTLILAKIANEVIASVKTSLKVYKICAIACGVIGMSYCFVKTADRSGISQIEKSELAKHVTTSNFENDLAVEVMNTIKQPGSEAVEMKIAELILDSYKKNGRQYADRSPGTKRLVEHCLMVMEARNPLVNYRGGKIRLLKLNLLTCSIEKTASGEYVATDLDFKEIERAEKKKVKNRKKREKQKMRKREEMAEENNNESEVFKRCMEAINRIL